MLARLWRVEDSMFDVHFLNKFLHPFKTAAVNGAEPKFPYGFLMGSGRVSLVFGKIELGIVMMVSSHQAVPGDLGDN